MPLHFGALTLEASSGPSADIGIDARPHITCVEELLSYMNARVVKAMQKVKNTASETLGHKWTGTTCGRVTDEGNVSCGQWDWSESKGSGSCLEAAQLRVTFLGKCHGMKING